MTDLGNNINIYGMKLDDDSTHDFQDDENEHETGHLLFANLLKQSRDSLSDNNFEGTFLSSLEYELSQHGLAVYIDFMTDLCKKSFLNSMEYKTWNIEKRKYFVYQFIGVLPNWCERMADYYYNKQVIDLSDPQSDFEDLVRSHLSENN